MESLVHSGTQIWGCGKPRWPTPRGYGRPRRFRRPNPGRWKASSVHIPRTWEASLIPVAQCDYFATKNDIFDGRREAGLNKSKKQKNVLLFSANPSKRPTGVITKCIPSMYVASLGAILSKIQGFYNESCWAPAPAPVIDYLILFPEALGAASRARFLYQKTTTKNPKNILGS